MRRVLGASEGLRQNLLSPTSEVPQPQNNSTRKAEFTRRTRQQQQQTEQRNIQPASVEIPTILGNKSTEGSGPINSASNKNDIVAWDMCMVLPNPNFIESTDSEPKSVELPHKDIIERLLIGGLITYQYYSGDNDEIIIKSNNLKINNIKFNFSINSLLFIYFKLDALFHVCVKGLKKKPAFLFF